MFLLINPDVLFTFDVTLSVCLSKDSELVIFTPSQRLQGYGRVVWYCVDMIDLDLLGCILMSVLFVGLNAICHMVSQSSSAVRSSWSSRLSSGLLILRK